MFGAKFQRKYALTDQGVQNTKKGTFWTVIVNLVVMGGVRDAPPDQQKKRDAYKKRTAKTDQLPFRQSQYHLGFHTGQILGYSHISQSNHLVSFKNQVRVRSLVTSLPHTSQPGVFCRANSSTRERSPASSTILSRVTSGFLLCSSTGEIMNWWTPALWRLGLPRLASRQISALPRVQ